MIDRDLLRQLGWSDALIEEVTRVADGINSSVALPPAVRDAGEYSVAIATSDAVFANAPYAPARPRASKRAT